MYFIKVGLAFTLFLVATGQPLGNFVSSDLECGLQNFGQNPVADAAYLVQRVQDDLKVYVEVLGLANEIANYARPKYSKWENALQRATTSITGSEFGYVGFRQMHVPQKPLLSWVRNGKTDCLYKFYAQFGQMVLDSPTRTAFFDQAPDSFRQLLDYLTKLENGIQDDSANTDLFSPMATQQQLQQTWENQVAKIQRNLLQDFITTHLNPVLLAAYADLNEPTEFITFMRGLLKINSLPSTPIIIQSQALVFLTTLDKSEFRELVVQMTNGLTVPTVGKVDCLDIVSIAGSDVSRLNLETATQNYKPDVLQCFNEFHMRPDLVVPHGDQLLVATMAQ